MGNKLIGLAAALAAILAVGAGLRASSPATGVLEGRLKILSQRPVQLADDASPKEEKVSYGEYPLVVLSKDGRTEIAQVTANDEGHFRVNLPPGDYILDLKRLDRNRPHSEPHPFTIRVDQTVRVDIDVDSNIRAMQAQ